MDSPPHDAATGRLLAKLGDPRRLRFVQITRDDRHVVLASFDDRAQLFSLEGATPPSKMR